MTDDPLRSFKGIWLAMWIGLVMWVVIGYSVSAYASYAKYRIDHCEISGCTNLNLEAHHIYAQSQRPDLADGDEGRNIITLCRYHHVQWGHCGNTVRWYNTNIVAMVRIYNDGRTEMKK